MPTLPTDTNRPVRQATSRNIKSTSTYMTIQYSKKVLDHFKNPRNMGQLKNPDGIGKVGNPVCGDRMVVYINIKNNKIQNIKFQTLGCAAAIATSSMITELARGKTLKQAEKITKKNISKALGKLPPIKEHCSNLASEALKKAIENYKKKNK